MNSPDSNLSWYAVQVKQTGLDICESFLTSGGYEYFSPRLVEEHRWSDRTKLFARPLFPGYLFCRFHPQHRLPVLKIPGVLGIVSSSNRLLEVDPSEIGALQKVVAAKSSLQQMPFIATGERVQVTRGAMQGTQGILLRNRSNMRLVLSVTMLGLSVAVEVDGWNVEPLAHCA